MITFSSIILDGTIKERKCSIAPLWCASTLASTLSALNMILHDHARKKYLAKGKERQ